MAALIAFGIMFGIAALVVGLLMIGEIRGAGLCALAALALGVALMKLFLYLLDAPRNPAWVVLLAGVCCLVGSVMILQGTVLILTGQWLL